jgi:hypothetical protein
MDNKNLIFLIIIIILCVIFYNSSISEKKEGFKNINIDKQSYNKYNETFLQPDTDNTRNTNNKEKGKNNKTWKHMNLDQCLQKCSQSEDCVAVSRDYTEDHEKANCYPRKTLGVVHSNRKGDANQRKNATLYNTYIKSTVPNQIKCINDNKLNMNQNVLIKSFKLPKKYVVVSSNEVRLKSYKLYGSKFIEEAQFKLVPGLEGSGTVSFKVASIIESNYYLSATTLNTLTIKNIYTDNTSFKKRCAASFELIDGLSDDNAVSLKTFNSDGPGKFVCLSGNKERLDLIDEQELSDKNNKVDKEDLTFQLVDTVNHNNIIEEGKMFKLASQSDNESDRKVNKGQEGFSGNTGKYKLRKFPKKTRNKFMSQLHPNDSNNKNSSKNDSFKSRFQDSGTINNANDDVDVDDVDDVDDVEDQNEYKNILSFLMENQNQKTSDISLGESYEKNNKLIIKDSISEYELPLLKYNYDYNILKRLLGQKNNNNHAIINNIIIPHGLTVSVYDNKNNKKDYYSEIILNNKFIKKLEIKMNNQNPYFKYAQDNIENKQMSKYNVMAHFYPKSGIDKGLLNKKEDELKQLRDLNYKLQKISQDNEIMNQDMLLKSKSKHDDIKLQKLARDYFFLKDKYDRAGNF